MVITTMQTRIVKTIIYLFIYLGLNFSLTIFIAIIIMQTEMVGKIKVKILF